MGNDGVSPITNTIYYDFNPRSLVGNDGVKAQWGGSSYISIHVPSWGTTDYRHTGSKDRKNFNPRSLVGNDGSLWPSGLPCAYFNPRSLVGNDFMGMSIRNLAVISIHVPSWGTTMRSVAVMFASYFNPRSLVGNDDLTFLVSIFGIISIHVPSWGTTVQQLLQVLSIGISIHVPSWGTTSNSFPVAPDIAYFNPRSLVGNDGKFSQIFFVFLCNKYNFSTFYYPFSLFFSVIHVTFLIFVVRILPAFYVYF